MRLTVQNAPMPKYTAPWTVGRAPLFVEAAEDFLGEVTRQQPWHLAKYEAWLDALAAFLAEDGLAPLTAFTDAAQTAWLASLDGAERAEATAMLAELRTYVTEWGWLAETAG